MTQAIGSDSGDVGDSRVANTLNLGDDFFPIINRADVGDRRVHDYCEAEEISILLEIPDDRRIAEAYSRGQMASDAIPAYREQFGSLVCRIKRELGVLK